MENTGIQNKKMSANLIQHSNHHNLFNRYSNSLSAPKPTGNNSGSVLKKKSHSINEKEKSMVVT